MSEGLCCRCTGVSHFKHLPFKGRVGTGVYVSETSGAELMRNRCAFTSRDMSESWADAFAYAIVFGWDGDEHDEESAMPELAAKHGWDEATIKFLRDAHRRFKALR